VLKGKGGRYEMPFRGFKSFKFCVRRMRKQGYKDDAARRICGKLYWKYEKR